MATMPTRYLLDTSIIISYTRQGPLAQHVESTYRLSALAMPVLDLNRHRR